MDIWFILVCDSSRLCIHINGECITVDELNVTSNVSFCTQIQSGQSVCVHQSSDYNLILYVSMRICDRGDFEDDDECVAVMSSEKRVFGEWWSFGCILLRHYKLWEKNNARIPDFHLFTDGSVLMVWNTIFWSYLFHGVLWTLHYTKHFVKDIFVIAANISNCDEYGCVDLHFE